MNKLRLSFLFCCIVTSLTVFGQLEKVIYQSFPIKDSTFLLSLNVNDPYEVQTWNGANVMVETTIRFEGAPIELLRLVIRDGRYNIQPEDHYPSTVLKSTQRWILKNNLTGLDIKEKITHRFYIPEEFVIKSSTEMSRRDDIIADARKD